ncbi:hypothetical protein NUW58_g1611 [Xylaria curta]|uniref:Uncharacterized protein n=1 Tax=Xylaria curta TaxID=42375 RepID=A0ACC1PKR6_9PEZI|nr:hypothetical protein NUW58_g1611 [Xylaria curta]
MGHVVVNPLAADAVLRHAILQAGARLGDFARSLMYENIGKDADTITTQDIGRTAKEGDTFALTILDDLNTPSCSCGNIADLCSYTPGRAALQAAKKLANQGKYDTKPGDVTEIWLRKAIAASHPLAVKVLHDATYPLALQILQLATGIGWTSSSSWAGLH